MKVGVIMGGNSSEREVSLKTGNEIIKYLNKDKYETIPIEITSGEELFGYTDKIDFALLALHGQFGEDGTIQGYFETMGIPYSGCGLQSSSICMDKAVSKMLLRFNGVCTPDWIVIHKDEPIEKYKLEKLGLPLFVKPNFGGSSIGVKKAVSYQEFTDAICEIMKTDKEVIVEQFIEGTEITCSILGEEMLPIIEINSKTDFFDYQSKYGPNGADERLVQLPTEVYERVKSAALTAYKSLKCSVYARVDMILQKGNPFVLEVNTLPGLTQSSLFPQSARAAGISMTELLDQIILLSLERRMEFPKYS
ncbi:D-alanine--D-alanine ligase [Paenibacillus cymbidii]|uniref:D-alanine--D-alanine ligase n=1 Tax=Paenibacillus cymbidii TaxID=1639034 RepID=UPI0010817CAE|nr:D-alanine--D-alanine ligase [Paenibacillus cymbidii]